LTNAFSACQHFSFSAFQSMPLIQPEIDFATSGPPDAAAGELDTFLALLRRQAGWITAHDALVILGFEASENRKRWLRKLAEASDGQIISGQAGYCHIDHATADQIVAAAAQLEHQAQAMGNRACAIRRRAHQNLVAAEVTRLCVFFSLSAFQLFSYA
jgi:LmbE family N-acetylglucosaminyl deacetylase